MRPRSSSPARTASHPVARCRARAAAVAATSSTSAWTAQRRLKADVLAEQLERLAGRPGTARSRRSGPAAPRTDWAGGPGCATRSTTRDDRGCASTAATRSSRCRQPAARSPIRGPRRWSIASGRRTPSCWPWPATRSTLLVDGRVEQGSAEITEHAAGRHWQLAADGFWQVHPGAADTLVGTVLDGLQARPGERAFDLYCGVGLFTGALVDAGVRSWGVEWSTEAIAHARRNVPEARFTAGKVERVLRSFRSAPTWSSSIHRGPAPART